MSEAAPLPTLTHIITVTTYADNRGIVVQDRSTVFGVAPRGFTRFNAGTTIGLEAPDGRTRPMRVEVGMEIPAAEGDTEADIIRKVFEAAPEMLEKQADLQMKKTEKDAIANQIRQAVGCGVPRL